MASLSEVFPSYNGIGKHPYQKFIEKKMQNKQNEYEATVPIPGHIIQNNPHAFNQPVSPGRPLYPSTYPNTLDNVINPQITAPLADTYGDYRNSQLNDNVRMRQNNLMES